MVFDVGARRQGFIPKAVRDIADKRLDGRLRIGEITFRSRKPTQCSAKIGLCDQQIALCLHSGLYQPLNLLCFYSCRCDMLLFNINHTARSSEPPICRANISRQSKLRGRKFSTCCITAERCSIDPRPRFTRPF